VDLAHGDMDELAKSSNKGSSLDTVREEALAKTQRTNLPKPSAQLSTAVKEALLASAEL